MDENVACAVRVRIYIIRYAEFFLLFFEKSCCKVLLFFRKCVPLSPQKRGWPFALCGRALFFLSFRGGSLIGFHRQIDTAVQERKRTVNVRLRTCIRESGRDAPRCVVRFPAARHYTVKSLILAQDER